MKILSIFFVAIVAVISIHPTSSFADPYDDEVDDDGGTYSDWEESLIDAGYTQVAWGPEGGAIFEWTASNGNILIAWWDNGPQADVYDPNGNCLTCDG